VGSEASGPGIGPQQRMPTSNWTAPDRRPAALDHGALRAQYERKWTALEDRRRRSVSAIGSGGSGGGGDRLVGFKDIPWPLPPPMERSSVDGGSSLCRSAADLADVLLWGASGGPAEVKARLRAEIMRWHSDKFVARWGDMLDPGQRPRIVAGVQAVSQTIIGLLQGGP